VFPHTDIFGDMRCFNRKWFDEFPDWLEYSISKDAAFCLYCYLFKQNNNLQGGCETFSSVGLEFGIIRRVCKHMLVGILAFTISQKEM